MKTTKRQLATWMTSEAAESVREYRLGFLEPDRGYSQRKVFCGCAIGRALAGMFASAEKAYTAFDRKFHVLEIEGWEAAAEILDIPVSLAQTISNLHFNGSSTAQIAQQLLVDAI